jgi:polysaccharide pyruvyl transferase WcaK-like protein
MEKLELSNYCVDIRDFDVDLVQKKFAAMVSNAEEIKYNMAAKLAKNREMLRSQFDELFGH